MSTAKTANVNGKTANTNDKTVNVNSKTGMPTAKNVIGQRNALHISPKKESGNNFRKAWIFRFRLQRKVCF